MDRKNKKQNQKPPKNYDLIKEIRNDKLYKANIKRRNNSARKYIETNCTEGVNKTKNILPGQLIMFNYFEPKTEEDLKYYDAMPCTIFFGIHKTKEGERVIGFNIHYYPPRIRYQLMDRVFKVFEASYIKHWSRPLNEEIPVFSYELFMYQLKQAKLDFGVRMYIPNLMAKITPVPPNSWHKAVFTEGAFKKTTREAIMNYWRQKIVDKNYVDKLGKRVK